MNQEYLRLGHAQGRRLEFLHIGVTMAVQIRGCDSKTESDSGAGPAKGIKDFERERGEREERFQD